VRACAVDGCKKNTHNRRYCPMHQSRLSNHGSTDPRPGCHGTPAERYERFVVRSESGCWAWLGATNDCGYGQISGWYAHRLSYEIHKGPIPEGLWVLHRCDNPPCSNPDHLFLGTAADNSADASRKGRLDGKPNQRCGEEVKSSKLVSEQVLEIRTLADAGADLGELARRYSVSKDNVWLIARRKSWKHL